MNRPITTLFLIQSIDGKISTGVGENMDVDKDFPKIPGLAEGLHEYYDLEKQMDRVSLNSGKVMAKICVNERKDPKKMDVDFVIIDNEPHLTQSGVKYLSDWVSKLYLVTNNPNHPVFQFSGFPNIQIMFYETLDFEKLLVDLKEKGVERITIQSGGTLNAEWIRKGLIDNLSIVVAPAMIGGKDTPTLMDGESLTSEEQLNLIKTFKLVEVKELEGSYVWLRYGKSNSI